jgi:hypothetical protein
MTEPVNYPWGLMGPSGPVSFGVSTPFNPFGFFQEDLAAWWRAENVELSAGAVSTIFDISGNNNHQVQATPALRPVWNAAGGPPGRPSILYNGTTQFTFSNSLILDPPSVKPIYVASLFREVTHVSNDRIYGNNNPGNVCLLFMAGATDFQAVNGGLAQVITPPAVGTYMLVEDYYSNTTGPQGDYLRIGATTIRTATKGNNSVAAGWFIGDDGTGVPSNIELVEQFIVRRNITPAERILVVAYLTRLGSGGVFGL